MGHPTRVMFHAAEIVEDVTDLDLNRLRPKLSEPREPGAREFPILECWWRRDARSRARI